jgi:CubicO group peptidase (beta-lactamase class C family)
LAFLLPASSISGADVDLGNLLPNSRLSSNPLPASKTQAGLLKPIAAEQVDTLLRDEMRERQIPGLQAAVIQHGDVVFLRAYGVADIQKKIPVTTKTLFPINSATKAFTGVACLQLVESGKLDLAAPVSAYLQDLPQEWRGVTVRQLLTHMSGIPDIIDHTGATIEGGDESAAWAKVQTLPMQFQPGERFSYNQTGYALLGRIITKLGGMPFVQFIAEKQLRPAGMAQTTYGDSRDITANTAVSYLADLTKIYEEYPPFMRGGAGINTSAEELARWIIKLQQGFFFKNKTTLSLMWTPGTFNNGEKGPRGLGWIVGDRPAHRTVGAEGGGRAAFAIYPDDDVAVIILTNQAASNPQELLDQIAIHYIPTLKLPGITVLRVELQRHGFQNAGAIASEIKAKDPAFEIPGTDLNKWGYRLLGKGKLPEALEIFKLTVSLYPENANAYDSLADAYEATGDKASAIVNYRRSLELDPRNTNAADRLKALGTAP